MKKTKAELTEYVDKYFSNAISQGCKLDRLFFRDIIQSKQFKKAQKIYEAMGFIPDQEKVLLMYDDTVFGSAKRGFLLTDTNFYVSLENIIEKKFQFFQFTLSEIEKIGLSENKSKWLILINEYKFEFIFLSDDEAAIFRKFLEKLIDKEQADFDTFKTNNEQQKYNFQGNSILKVAVNNLFMPNSLTESHILDGIPFKMLQGACQSHFGKINPGETPLILVDFTLFGSGKKGALITTDNLSWCINGEKNKLSLGEIWLVENLDDHLQINKTYSFPIFDQSLLEKIHKALRLTAGELPEMLTIFDKPRSEFKYAVGDKIHALLQDKIGEYVKSVEPENDLMNDFDAIIENKANNLIDKGHELMLLSDSIIVSRPNTSQDIVLHTLSEKKTFTEENLSADQALERVLEEFILDDYTYDLQEREIVDNFIERVGISEEKKKQICVCVLAALSKELCFSKKINERTIQKFLETADLLHISFHGIIKELSNLEEKYFESVLSTCTPMAKSELIKSKERDSILYISDEKIYFLYEIDGEINFYSIQTSDSAAKRKKEELSVIIGKLAKKEYLNNKTSFSNPIVILAKPENPFGVEFRAPLYSIQWLLLRLHSKYVGIKACLQIALNLIHKAPPEDFPWLSALWTFSGHSIIEDNRFADHSIEFLKANETEHQRKIRENLVDDLKNIFDESIQEKKQETKERVHQIREEITEISLQIKELSALIAKANAQFEAGDAINHKMGARSLRVRRRSNRTNAGILDMIIDWQVGSIREDIAKGREKLADLRLKKVEKERELKFLTGKGIDLIEVVSID